LNPQKEEAARVHKWRKLSNHDVRTPGKVFRIGVPRVLRSQGVPDVKKTECNTKCMMLATVGSRSRLQVPIKHLDKYWRKLLSPQKEEVARVHGRRKLLESTEGGSC